MNRHVSAARRAVEDIIMDAEAALDYIEGVEARVDYDPPPLAERAVRNLRTFAAFAVVLYLVIAAMSVKLPDPTDAISSWRVDNHVRIVSRTDYAIDQFIDYHGHH